MSEVIRHCPKWRVLEIAGHSARPPGTACGEENLPAFAGDHLVPCPRCLDLLRWAATPDPMREITETHRPQGEADAGQDG